MSSSSSSPILYTPAMAFVGEWAGVIPSAVTFFHRLGFKEQELIEIFQLGTYVDRLPEGIIIDHIDIHDLFGGEPEIRPTNMVVDVKPLEPLLQSFSEVNSLLMKKSQAITFLDDVYWDTLKTHPRLKGKTTFADWLPDPTPHLKSLQPYLTTLKTIEGPSSGFSPRFG